MMTDPAAPTISRLPGGPHLDAHGRVHAIDPDPNHSRHASSGSRAPMLCGITAVFDAPDRLVTCDECWAVAVADDVRAIIVDGRTRGLVSLYPARDLVLHVDQVTVQRIATSRVLRERGALAQQPGQVEVRLLGVPIYLDVQLPAGVPWRIVAADDSDPARVAWLASRC